MSTLFIGSMDMGHLATAKRFDLKNLNLLKHLNFAKVNKIES